MRRFTYWLAVLLPTLFIVSDGCQNPLEGVKLGLKEPIQAGIIECRLYDPAGNALPQTSQVIISGPDAEYIVTTVNTKKYKINEDGVLMVAVSPSVAPSAARPIRFTVAIETPDYQTIVQPFVLTSATTQSRRLPLISLSKPPVSINPASQQGRANSNGQTDGITLNTAGASQAEAAKVSISAGTQFEDREGRPVGGKLIMQVIHANNRTGDGAGQLPGGPVFADVRSPMNESLGALRTQSIAGSVAVTLFNEQYQTVHHLSKPGQLIMELNPNTFNPVAGRAIQAGDSIPLFTYDAFLNTWQQQKAGVITKNASTGRLILESKFTETVTQIAAWASSVCAVGPVFAVKSKLKDVDVKYKCQLVDSKTNNVVSTFFADVNQNAQITIPNQERGRTFKLRVYDETDAWGKGKNGGLVGESPVAASCDSKPVKIDLKDLPEPPSMKLDFRFVCSKGKKVDDSLTPALMKTQYTEVGKNNWRDLVSATRKDKTVTSCKLQVGRKYDLRASIDGGATWPFRQMNQLIDKTQWTLDIKADIYCK